MGTAYIVDAIFPTELGAQCTPGQNFPPVHYNDATYQVVAREQLFGGDPSNPSTFAIFKTTNSGVAFTGQDTGAEQTVQFVGSSYNDLAAYYPPEGGSNIYLVYTDGEGDNTLCLVIFDLATDTWGTPITGGPAAAQGSPSFFANFIVRTTGEWIIVFKNFGQVSYVSYNAGWGSPVALQSIVNFNTFINCGRDATDNVVFFGTNGGGQIQTRRLSSGNVLSAIHSSGITPPHMDQDQWAKPIYTSDGNFVTAYSDIVYPGTQIHSIKCDAATCASFSTEVIAGPWTSNFDLALGPANPLNIGPIQGEQGLSWPRLAISSDGLTIYCVYNLNDDSVAALNTNNITLATQAVGDTTWSVGTAVFDTNSDTLVPDNHIAFGIDPATPVPVYRMGFAIFSGGTQAFSYGTITFQTADAPSIDPDDFGNNQYYFEIPSITITCPLDSDAATVGVLFTSTAPVVTGDTPPDTFVLLSGPGWMSIDSATGVVSGIPDVSGAITYVIQVTDNLGNVADTSPGCDLDVAPSAPTLPCALPNTGQVGVPFSVTLVASGGVPPYIYHLLSAPGFLTLAGDVLSGIPTTNGVFTYTATVTDSLDQTATSPDCPVTISPGPPPAPGPLRSGNTLRWQIEAPQRPGRWFAHRYFDVVEAHYAVEPSASAPNDQELYLLSSNVWLCGGNTDNNSPIQVCILVPSNDQGDERSQKLYPDAMVQWESSGTLNVTPAFDNAQTFAPTLPLVGTGPIVQDQVNIASLGDLSLYRNVGTVFAWTGGPDGPRVLAWEPAAYLQPYLSKRIVTQYINWSYPGWKHVRRFYPGLISNTPVTFTIETQDNRVFTVVIPSTGGQFRIIPLIIPHGCKDLGFAIQLDGLGHRFALFPDAFTLEAKGWADPEYLQLAVWKT